MAAYGAQLVDSEQPSASMPSFDKLQEWTQSTPDISKKPVLHFDSFLSNLKQSQSSSTVISGLDDFYVITDREAIPRFIEENWLNRILLEARDVLDSAFGKARIKSLALVRDEEGVTTLFCLIMTSGRVEQAAQSLREFDRWWIDRAHNFQGKLSFDIELI